MSSMPSPAQSEFSEGSLPVKPPVEAPAIRPADLKNDRFPKRRQSLGMRVPLAVARFLITFCVGVAATLAWQSYGDAAREMIANSSPQLGWLAPQAPVAQTIPNTIEQIVTRIVDRIVTNIVATQEPIARAVDELTAGQEQLTREIVKLEAISQYGFSKSLEPPP